MEILTSIGGDLRHGETHKLNMGYFFFFEVEFDLEGQGPSPPSTKEILIKVYYTFGPNLVILAWTGSELSRGQASDWNTDWHTHTDTHTQRRRRWHTQRPKLASGNKIVARGCDTITSKTIEWGKKLSKALIYHWKSLVVFQCKDVAYQWGDMTDILSSIAHIGTTALFLWSPSLNPWIKVIESFAIWYRVRDTQ